ncbi:Rne/Rng family ribonuclease [Aeromicrobium sp. CF3.5]|uniref:Rne/Rng family ribonuclease n=1 Tax=Aeromicrobium sp. CF3.5 TaxID=3373078 RepID=UPI003EE528DC
MLDDDSNTPTTSTEGDAADEAPKRRRAAGRAAGPPAAVSFSAPATSPASATPERAGSAANADDADAANANDADGAPQQRAPRKRPARKARSVDSDSDDTVESPASDASADETPVRKPAAAASAAAMFRAPAGGLAPARQSSKSDDDDEDEIDHDRDGRHQTDDDSDDDEGAPKRRRRSRGGRRRRKGDGDSDGEVSDEDSEPSTSGRSGAGGGNAGRQESGRQSSGGGRGDDNESDDDSGANGGTRRRRRRARAGDQSDSAPDDPDNTVVRVRKGRSADDRQSRSAEDEITGVAGSTRLEAKKQRRREGREAGRRRAPIVSEAEFLARRESVDRQMVVRQKDDYTQIAVLEDKVLVEHYVARESQTSLIGNVYLGKVQNVLPSMEAAFVDIGAGRNAVIYAGEVDWSSVGNGKARKIEDALSPGQVILVQVTKDPVGQKGARLTSQVSLPGRFLVLVPGGQTSGISRKLPENERNRLKALLKEVLPDGTGVIVRTAAEGASEEQLTRDVGGLTARWTDIEAKVADGKAPQLLYSEPDLMIKVVRDLFNEDFAGLIVEGDDSWDMIKGYVDHVAPDLAERVSRWENADTDAFTSFRIDEQIHKALDRKVFLPSGGSLVIDRTEAMTVVDVNTGKYTGSGGNLEETVTKNNLEAAEEVVRQLRLRDIGGIIVVDFIDMVLESNRDLVLRRLVECLGRDRTRHQVAEVTSLGLVQMTRKRIGTGLLESFSVDCDHCKGRGVVIADTPVEPKKDDGPRRGGRGGGRSGRAGSGGGSDAPNGSGSNGSGSSNAGGNGGGGNRNGGRNHPKPEAPRNPAPQDSAPADPRPSDSAPADSAPADSVPASAPAETTPEVSAPEHQAPVAPRVEAPAAVPAPQAEPREATPEEPTKKPVRRRAASKPAGPPPPVLTSEGEAP